MQRRTVRRADNPPRDRPAGKLDIEEELACFRDRDRESMAGIGNLVYGYRGLSRRNLPNRIGPVFGGHAGDGTAPTPGRELLLSADPRLQGDLRPRHGLAPAGHAAPDRAPAHLVRTQLDPRRAPPLDD